EQLRCREEHHVHRKIEDGVDEHALLDDDVVEPVLLGGDRGRESRRTRAHDQDITNRHPSIIPAHPQRECSRQPRSGVVWPPPPRRGVFAERFPMTHTRRSHVLTRLVLITALLTLPVLASAQEATMSGTITDSTGGVLPGVTVTAVH